ncbi:baseplate multidomain protein megatron [Nitratireductor sp. CH_MIT9313-5]|uniref:baseplate multidomain protein megatron n=1 Tax=Nitratireductor sp. CH_MIT9313-5 TaxID=3107764 RepID=UPI003009F3FB
MAVLVLQAAGAFLGGIFGSAGAAIGSAAGALAGYAIDRSLIESTKHYEGPKLGAARPFSAEEGAPLPRIYGTARIGGTMIWATRFEETATTTRQGSKGGGPKTTTYSYFANVAFALCEGEIAGVRRIWADGRELDRDKVEMRVYRGTADQQPDPLIEAKQGGGNAPAYRGTAYVVFERLPIDEYGNRIPQMHFEVMRPASPLNSQIRSVALIPGSTEYGLSPTPVTRQVAPGEVQAVNRHVTTAPSDLEASLDELQALFPNIETVSVVVSWFGDDLRAGYCAIRPKVVAAGAETHSMHWRVSNVTREHAQAVSRVSGKAAFGGTPTDESVIAAIRAIKGRGLKVALYPFVMMDVPPGNELPDPYSAGHQPSFPWRGRITCHPAAGQPGSVDRSDNARQQVSDFCGGAGRTQFTASGNIVAFNGSSDDWGYRRFLLHYAHLAKAAGGVDGFLIGSELRGLTTIRDAARNFPFVEHLESLAEDVRAILGSGVTLTYGADWSEYFGYQPSDGSGDLYFHLDRLWAHPAVDAVGIDNYMPLADWRDTDMAEGNPDGFTHAYDVAAMQRAITSGEGFDWYYQGKAERERRERSAITDGAYGKHWVWRYKDLKGWWSNLHYERVGGVEKSSPTPWVPRSKPIHFTELGCAAVDKGPNQPNMFPDPKSSENGLPHFSNGGRSDAAQASFLQAHFNHWLKGGTEANPISPIYGREMVDPASISIWAWDARPYPAFPLYRDVWGDGDNWATGHWLTGRQAGSTLQAVVDGILADFEITAADTAGLSGQVNGYVIANPTTAHEALEPLVALFGVDVFERDGRLVFAQSCRSAKPAKTLSAMVLGEEGVVERRREPEHALPERAELSYRDALNEHQSAAATSDHLGVNGNGTRYVSFPGVLEASEADELARDWLKRVWNGRETVRLAVPASDRSFDVGDIVRLEGKRPEYLVSEVDEGLVRQLQAQRIARQAMIAPAARLPDRPVPPGLVAGPPHALFLDLPMLGRDVQAREQFAVAVRARPWRNQVLLASPEDSGFELRRTVEKRATIGNLAQPLPGGTISGRLDEASGLVVKLMDGELASVSRARLLNGANAAAIRASNGQWEIIQFAQADEVGADVWTLSGLLRGQAGTEDAMNAGAPTGADFVLLDEAVVPAGLSQEEVGLQLNWKVGPAGHDLSSSHFITRSVSGGMRALLPLAPVHLRARAVGGDLILSWVRRGRVEADTWLGEDIPLGEAEENYRLEILATDGNVRRSVSRNQAEYRYTAAQIEEDFPNGEQAFDLHVRQIGAIGPGLVATARFSLP